jgi:hypothetical protein
MELSAGKILKETQVQSAFHQTLGDEYTFQQDNNPKHKAKSILELVPRRQGMFLSGRVTVLS